jgi:ABC-type dipeptide/oligopeptide/nickel transport system permease component
MLKIMARRLATLPIMLLIVSIVVFAVLRAIPSDPIAMIVPPGATQADIESIRQTYGFNLPLPQQYLLWLEHALTGDLGQSIYFREPVTTLLAKAFPATAELATTSLLLALLLSIPGGLFLYRLKSTASRIAAELGIVTALSVPSFLWAIFFILLFGVAFPILPFTGRISGNTILPDITGFALIDLLLTLRLHDWLDAALHLLLPSLALALSFAPPVIRVLRSSLLDTEREDYVTYARQRGVPERDVLISHMLRNAALPTITLIGLQFGFLFGGTLLVEIIFSFPGLGSLTVQAVRNHDLPLLQGAALVFCVVVLLTNTIVDALYVILNPRLRAPA